MESAIVLPIDGVNRVCRLFGADVTPESTVPGADDARFYACANTGRVVVMDSGKKRAGLYELKNGPARLEKVLPFANLPSGCVGHTALPFDGGMLVGGHSRSGESLWIRTNDAPSQAWQSVKIFSALRRPGKAIDGLHIRDSTLIAVDNIVTPKWLILYDVRPKGKPRLRRKHLLPSHISYEKILASFLGEDHLWCLSRGMSHGIGGTFLWGIDPRSFHEKVVWPVRHAIEGNHPFRKSVSEPAASPSPLQTARGIYEWQGWLLIPCSDRGFVKARIPEAGGTKSPADFVKVPGIDLRSVTSVSFHPCEPSLGVFVIGSDEGGKSAFRWVPASMLDS